MAMALGNRGCCTGSGVGCDSRSGCRTDVLWQKVRVSSRERRRPRWPDSGASSILGTALADLCTRSSAVDDVGYIAASMVEAVFGGLGWRIGIDIAVYAVAVAAAGCESQGRWSLFESKPKMLADASSGSRFESGDACCSEELNFLYNLRKIVSRGRQQIGERAQYRENRTGGREGNVLAKPLNEARTIGTIMQ